LQVLGDVVSAGLRNADRRVIDHGPELLPGLPSQSIESTRTDAFPYLYLADPNDASRAPLLLCYFDPDQLDSVARIPRGARVMLEGTFQGYTQGATQVILNSCVTQ
jgi:hypothetical protein